MSQMANFSEQIVVDETDNINRVGYSMDSCMETASVKLFE